MADKTVEELKAEAERIALENLVKEAQAKLAAAQAQASAAAKPKILDFAGFIGQPGRDGLFVISGEHLGKTNPIGSVSINGHTAKLTAVRAGSIKGLLPFDVKPGAIVVKVGDVSFAAKVA